VKVSLAEKGPAFVVTGSHRPSAMAPPFTNSLDWLDSQKPMFSRPIHLWREGVLDHRHIDVRRTHVRHGEEYRCTVASPASLDSSEHIRGG
jgi:hypothetical protein